MGLTLNKVHNYVRDEETNRMILQSKSPYKRFVKEGETPVIVQGGRFYSDGGQRISSEDVPKYAMDILRRTTDEGLRAIGLTEDDLRVTKDKNKEGKAPKLGADERPPTLVEVLMSLNHNDDTHWTKAGLPDLNVVKENFGRYCSRQTVTEAIEGLERKE